MGRMSAMCGKHVCIHASDWPVHREIGKSNGKYVVSKRLTCVLTESFICKASIFVYSGGEIEYVVVSK